MDGFHDDINTTSESMGVCQHAMDAGARRMREECVGSEGAVLASEGELPHSGLLGQCCHHLS